jgi:leucyl/phenylalanyl-tRNA---protein transferase
MIAYLHSGTKIFPGNEVKPIEDVVALSEELDADLILSAYQQGAFPWYQDDIDKLFYWFSPDPRCVLLPEQAHISRSMKRFMAKAELEFVAKADFATIMIHCGAAPRRPTFSNGVLYSNDNTWISSHFIDAYCDLESNGQAIAFAAYQNGRMVAGMYGVLHNQVFYGESMFHYVTNASKFVFLKVCEYLSQKGVRLFDCQMQTNHLLSLGAQLVSRAEYLSMLQKWA